MSAYGAMQMAGNAGFNASPGYGGGGMDPMTLAAMGAQFAGGLFGGGPSDPAQTYTGVGSLPQTNLLNSMILAAQQGSGEFGFGPAAQQGYQTMANQMGQRGISMDSGVAQSALGNMMQQAIAGDTASRRNYMMGLAQARPWTVNYQNLDHTLDRSAFRQFHNYGGGEPAQSGGSGGSVWDNPFNAERRRNTGFGYKGF